MAEFLLAPFPPVKTRTPSVTKEVEQDGQTCSPTDAVQGVEKYANSSSSWSPEDDVVSLSFDDDKDLTSGGLLYDQLEPLDPEQLHNDNDFEAFLAVIQD